jgi:hypothetical protein
MSALPDIGAVDHKAAPVVATHQKLTFDLVDGRV